MEAKNKYFITKCACYTTNVTMSAVSNLTPILFLTFHKMYDVSYTLLGLLVAINFSTQLLIDLIFTFFSEKFNIHKTVKYMPLIAFFGFLIYALLPALFPGYEYLFIALGTVVFAVSSGLNEVLISPLIAAIQSDNPDREMSKLHSVYAWGVVLVVIVSTVFLKIFGTHSWKYLACLLALIPLCAFLLFIKAPLPDMNASQKGEKTKKSFTRNIILCFFIILSGGATELAMGQWVSGYIESAIGISKIWGDIFGVAVFSALLGLGRSLYSNYGRNISSVMLLGMAGAFICYLLAGFSFNPVIGLIACALTGFFVSMLWPGTLILLEKKVPTASVGIYALMAAGGDLGASLAPQMVGIISDTAGNFPFIKNLAFTLNVTAEQLGMRSGLLLSSLFPLMGIILLIVISKEVKK